MAVLIYNLIGELGMLLGNSVFIAVLRIPLSILAWMFCWDFILSTIARLITNQKLNLIVKNENTHKVVLAIDFVIWFYLYPLEGSLNNFPSSGCVPSLFNDCIE